MHRVSVSLCVSMYLSVYNCFARCECAVCAIPRFVVRMCFMVVIARGCAGSLQRGCRGWVQPWAVSSDRLVADARRIEFGSATCPALESVDVEPVTSGAALPPPALFSFSIVHKFPLSRSPALLFNVAHHLAPLPRTEDWEAVSAHAAVVQERLLQQMSVVASGQVFPFWITRVSGCGSCSAVIG
jgi:hypothetical protein